VEPGVPSFPSESSADRDLASVRALTSAGRWEEALEPLGEMVANGVPSGDLALLYGETLMRTGRERAAREWLTQVEPTLAVTDRAAHRQVFNMIGVVCFVLGDLDEAAGAFSEALDLASQNDDLLLLARASNNLGAIANMQGKHATALGHYRLAVPAYQRVGQARGIAEGYHNLAITFRDLGELEEADENERRAIEYATDGAVPRLAAMGRIGRAEIALRRGDARLAEMTARMAAEELERLGDPWHEADAHRVVGVASGAQGHLADALVAFDRALVIARSRGHSLNEADTLRDRAILMLRQGEREWGERDARTAIEIFRKLGAAGQCEALERALARTNGER
jgi:tetratricopeptide (TPR) repeat protein